MQYRSFLVGFCLTCLPVTLRLTTLTLVGKVEIWQRYTPASEGRRSTIRRPQFPGWPKRGLNLNTGYIGYK